MVTFTVRHHLGEKLKDVIARVYRAFRLMRLSRAAQSILRAKVKGTVRAFEVTHGVNGWHAHIHLLLLLSEELRALEYATFEGEFMARANAVAPYAVVWSKPAPAGNAKAAGLYISKLGAEAAGIAKEPKNGNRTPWQIAADAADGDSESAKLWFEYQTTIKGRRFLVIDSRAKAMAEREPEIEEPTERLEFSLFAEEVKRIAQQTRFVPDAWFLLFEACRCGPDPPTDFRKTLDDLLEWAPKKAA